MRIPAGRIIRMDMGESKWGRVIYMVVNQPIVCEHCDMVLFDWREESGDVVCPYCGQVVKDRFYYPCPRCHGDDYHTLRVVNNDNWHYDSISGEVTEYNDQKNRIISVCGKSLMDDLKHQRMFLLTAKESQDMKRKLVWNSSLRNADKGEVGDYDPLKPMPQWIIDKFPYSAQK